jgi:hypothetical protein
MPGEFVSNVPASRVETSVIHNATIAGITHAVGEAPPDGKRLHDRSARHTTTTILRKFDITDRRANRFRIPTRSDQRIGSGYEM